MAKKLLCLLLVLTLILSMSMVSFAECGVLMPTEKYRNAYCVTPICIEPDIPTQYVYALCQEYCNGAVYTREVLTTRGCCPI